MNDSTKSPDRPDDEDTRTALMTAARALFAEQGYDGASVRAITSRAGANLGAVTYHFGSKEGLYLEVLAGMMSPLRDRITAVATREASALDRLDGVVEAYFDHFSRHGDLPRFLIERMASGQLPPPPVAALMRSILGTVSGIVRQGQADGTVRAGDPILLTLSLVAQPVYLTLVQEPLRRVVGLDLGSPRGLAQLVAHARAFVRAGLSTHPADVP